MPRTTKIRVLIGDRQPIFRSGLSYLLAQQPGISVVGEAGDNEQTLKMAEERKPNIVLLDSMMLEHNGPELLQELHHKYKNLRVILLTPTEKEADSAEMYRKRAAGVMPKQSALENLVECIQRVDSGEAWTSMKPEAAAEEHSPEGSAFHPAAKEHSPLSVREKQVVSLVSQGYRNKEIAERMFISEQTVKNHMHNIFDKLGVSDRLELALYAIHKNLQTME